MATSEIAVSAAVNFFQDISANAGKPFNLAFSTKSTSTDIAADALKFSTQLVSDVNNQLGIDTDTATITIDEFTRLASGNKIKTFAGITDSAKKSLIQDTFNEISGDRSTATASDIAEYIRIQDTKDAKTDGHAVLNFLI